MSLESRRSRFAVRFIGLVESAGEVVESVDTVSGANIAVWFLLYLSSTSSRSAVPAARPASS